jgi:hypothetical protein
MLKKRLDKPTPCRLPGRRGVPSHPNPCLHERTHQPWPDSSLMVDGIAFIRAAFIPVRRSLNPPFDAPPPLVRPHTAKRSPTRLAVPAVAKHRTLRVITSHCQAEALAFAGHTRETGVMTRQEGGGQESPSPLRSREVRHHAGLECVAKLTGQRVLSPRSPTGCSPKSTCDGRGLRARRGAPLGATRRRLILQRALRIRCWDEPPVSGLPMRNRRRHRASKRLL